MHRSPHRLRSALISLALVASAVVAASVPAGAAGEALGIDVSHWQGTINWSSVAGAGKTFAFLKATQGTSFLDDRFAANRTGANNVGIPIGAYHFADVTKSPTVVDGAIAEADWFVSSAQPKAGDLPPVLDIEKNNGLGQVKVTKWILTWLEEVRQQTGIYPMIYTSPSGWRDRTGDTTDVAAAGYGLLWVAHWTDASTPTLPANNWGGKGWTFWQYSSSGTVPGISGSVDLDRYKSTDVSPLLLRQLTITKTSVAGKIGGVQQDGLGGFCNATCMSTTRLSVGGATTTLAPQSTDANTTWTWGGACAGSPAGGTCTLSMTADRAVTITYQPITAPITVVTAGTGSGAVASNTAGISCTSTAGVISGTCTAPFAYNSSVTLTATAAAGSTFTGWSGGICSGTSTCSLTADAAKTVTATFQPSAATFTLTTTMTGTGTGTVTAAPTISCPGVCSAAYASGTTASVTQAASAGSRFVGWSGVCTGVTTCSPVMTADRSVNAIFAQVVARTLTPSTSVVLTSVRKGQYVTFTGTLANGGDARCSVSAQTVGLWTSTGTSALATGRTGSTGTYTFSRKMTALGTFTFVVKAPEVLPATLGNAICGAATSATFTVTVN